MKQKTHSGAKKRFRLKPSGKVKRKHCGMRHLQINKGQKSKRLLAKATYVDSANEYQVSRQLVF